MYLPPEHQCERLRRNPEIISDRSASMMPNDEAATIGPRSDTESTPLLNPPVLCACAADAIATGQSAGVLLGQKSGPNDSCSKWRGEAMTLISYAAPLVVSFFLQYSIDVSSVVAAGRLGKIELGAVSCQSVSMPASRCYNATDPCHSGQHVGSNYLFRSISRPNYKPGYSMFPGVRVWREAASGAVLPAYDASLVWLVDSNSDIVAGLREYHHPPRSRP